MDMEDNAPQEDRLVSGCMGLQFMRLPGSDPSGNDYFRATEIGYFMSRLLDYLASTSSAQSKIPSDDVVDVCSEFFRKLASGKYVADMPFSGILQTHRSRVCLVRSCISAFKDVPASMDVTIGDVHALMTLLCTDVPVDFIADAATYVTSSDSSQSPCRYPFATLSRAVYFAIVFKDWLGLFLSIFDPAGDHLSISLPKDIFMHRFDELINSVVNTPLGVQLPVLGSVHAGVSEFLLDKQTDYKVSHYFIVKFMTESNDVCAFLQAGSSL